MSLACHYRIATPNAAMGLPEVKIGLLPARRHAAAAARGRRRNGVADDRLRRPDRRRGGAQERAGRPHRAGDSFQGVLDFAQELVGRRTHRGCARHARCCRQALRPRRISPRRGRGGPAGSRAGLAAEVRRRGGGGRRLPFEEGVKIERAMFLDWWPPTSRRRCASLLRRAGGGERSPACRKTRRRGASSARR